MEKERWKVNLVTINNVRGYIDKNGTAWLKLEDVARGLGFTTVATSGNECVRWSRVEQYLTELGFNKDNGYLPDDTFIPENIFYRLAMKAKNETAEKFQAIVADEILPTIRKTGTYSTKQMSQLEILAQAAQALVEHEKAIAQIAATQTEQAGRIAQLENKVSKRFTDDHNLQVVTPTQLGMMFEPALSGQAVNKRLQQAGLQWKCGGDWVSTVEGKKYSTAEPLQLDNGKITYRLYWQRRVKELIG